MKMVLFPAVDDDRLRRIAAATEAMAVVNAQDQHQAITQIADADAFFGKLTPELLAASQRLRWVQSPTASLEHYIFPALVAHPCTLTNMRGLFSDVMADHVFGYILCFARNLHRYLHQQAQGIWQPIGGEQARSTMTAGPAVVSSIDCAHLHLSDATLGVVGFGQIGQEVARRAAAFGMRTMAVDPLPASDTGLVEEVWPVDQVHRLLAGSDFVVVTVPHTPESVKMFRRAEFQAMRKSAYFINVGRGAVVDLADLVAALDAKEIAGAALDVFEVEPLPPNHPLWRMENVLLTPHVAAASPRIAERHLKVLLENIQRFTAGEPLRNVVDKVKWF